MTEAYKRMREGTGPELEDTSDRLEFATLEFGTIAEGATQYECNITATLKDSAGETITGIHSVLVFLSETATGAAITTAVPSTTFATESTYGNVLASIVTRAVIIFRTNASGVIQFSIVDSAKAANYVHAQVMGSARTSVSRVLATADYKA